MSVYQRYQHVAERLKLAAKTFGTIQLTCDQGVWEIGIGPVWEVGTDFEAVVDAAIGKASALHRPRELVQA